MRESIKIENTIIKFGDTETEKFKFHQYKKPISLRNINMNKIVSNKISFRKRGFKYFIGFKDAEKIRPLCISLPKMSALMKLNICLF